VLLHNMPDYPFRYAATPVFACPADTSEQSSGRNSSCSHPKFNGPFDSFGNRHGSNVAAFADQINYGPMLLARLLSGRPLHKLPNREHPVPGYW